MNVKHSTTVISAAAVLFWALNTGATTSWKHFSSNLCSPMNQLYNGVTSDDQLANFAQRNLGCLGQVSSQVFMCPVFTESLNFTGTLADTSAELWAWSNANFGITIQPCDTSWATGSAQCSNATVSSTGWGVFDLSIGGNGASAWAFANAGTGPSAADSLWLAVILDAAANQSCSTVFGYAVNY